MTAIDLPTRDGVFHDDVLLITVPQKVPQAWIDRVQATYPGLRVVFRQLEWHKTLPAGAVTAEDWSKVAVLVTTGYALPVDVATVPRLRYVQLFSAGANTILTQPLFTDTDIVFATANGVHG